MNPDTDSTQQPTESFTDKTLLDQVEQITCKLLERETLDHNLDLGDAGLDSLAKLELLAILERELNVELTEDLISEFKTVAHVVKVVIGATSK